MIYKITFLLFFLTLGNMKYGTAQTAKLFLVAGQSNCVGMGDAPLSVVCDSSSAFEYKASQNRLTPLKDPVGENYLSFQQASTGSAWPSFAYNYHLLTNDTIIIVPAARGGSSCNKKAEIPHDGTWDSSGDILLFPNAVTKTKMAEQKTGLPLSGIIWIQGERDANAINSKQLTEEEFKKSMQNLISRFRNELGASVPFYIVQTGVYVHHPVEGFNIVRKVQQWLADNIQDVFLAYGDANKFPERDWMKDEIHYKQAAYNEIGKKVAAFVADKEKQ
jgi:hypothetical protein